MDMDTGSELVDNVSAYVKQYMSRYDGSHDFLHVLRVLGLARHIAGSTPSSCDYDPLIITLSALLHDVGDKKYLQPGQDPSTLVQQVLLDFGVEDDFAKKIQTIVTAISYSSEIKDPARVQDLIALYPELAVVQDADRLDAIGAIGIGRTFTYGGAVGGARVVDLHKAVATDGLGNGKGAEARRGMEETINHFTDKLERLEGMMKTEVGRKIARERTRRLKWFREWWAEELETANKGLAMECVN